MTPDADFQSVFPDSAGSLASRFLTPAMFMRLSRLETATGFTLAEAIRSGRENPDSDIGIYAGDAETYTLFREIFHPVIRAYHQITGPIRHVSSLESLDLPNPDPENRFILSTRIRVARNLSGYAFMPHITPQDRQDVAQQIKQVLTSLPASLQGHFHAMDGLTPDQISIRASRGTAFPPGDRFQSAAGITRDFPASRGVFISHDQTVRVWVNEEDQLRVICLEKTGALDRVFNRMVSVLGHISNRLDFAADTDLGCLNACPTNIGSAMRASVHIQLPELETHPDLLRTLALAHGLQVRGTQGEKTAVTKSVFDISNRYRLGIGETRLIQGLHTGIAAVIAAEKQLAASGPVSPAP
jgi:creatine kinase/arginine kinase